MNILKKIKDKQNPIMALLSYIAISDFDSSYLDSKYLKKAKILKYLYILVILITIIITLVPLFFTSQTVSSNSFFIIFNLVAFLVFLLDYCFRWITFPFRVSSKTKAPLLTFPFSGVSLILIASILPSIISVFSPIFSGESGAEFVRIVSTLVILRLGRLLLLLNIFPPFRIIKNVLYKQRTLLFNTFLFLMIVVILFSLVIFRAEIGHNPKITSYWDAFYFTIISITTIGYGDIVVVTDLGRAMVIILAIVGVALFTIPSGIIAGGFINEIKSIYKEDKKEPPQREKTTFLQTSIKKSVKAIIHTDKTKTDSNPTKDDESKKDSNTRE